MSSEHVELYPNQIEALSLGLTRQDVTMPVEGGADWWRLEASSLALEYIRNRTAAPPQTLFAKLCGCVRYHTAAVTPQTALADVIGLKSNQIRAMLLGSTREEVTTAYWFTSEAVGYALQYATGSTNPKAAFADLIGLGSKQIQVMLLGFTKAEVTAAGWFNSGVLGCALQYATGSTDPRAAFSDLIGLGSNQMQAMSLGFTKAEVTIPGTAVWLGSGAGCNALSLVKDYADPKAALAERIGLNSNQIRAMSLGFTNAEVTAPGMDVWFDSETGYNTLSLVKDYADPKAALAERIGLNRYQIKAMSMFGLTRDEVIIPVEGGLNWWKDQASECFNYIRRRTKAGVAAGTALAEVVGLSGNQIKTMSEIGLTRRDDIAPPALDPNLWSRYGDYVRIHLSTCFLRGFVDRSKLRSVMDGLVGMSAGRITEETDRVKVEQSNRFSPSRTAWLSAVVRAGSAVERGIGGR